MLEFRVIDITDKERITKALSKSQFMGCEYSFANNMAWRRLADSQIAFYKDFYICCSFTTEDGIPRFFLPSGEGSYIEVMGAMKEYAYSMGKPLRVAGVTDNSLEMLNELFPDSFTVDTDEVENIKTVGLHLQFSRPYCAVWQKVPRQAQSSRPLQRAWG